MMFRLYVVLLAVASFLLPFSASASSAEEQALKDLYTSCGGSDWMDSTNWLLGDPCTNRWFGVGCSFSHVVKLVLPSNGLKCGEIPASIRNLSELAFLDLSHNEVQGTIPPAIQYLRQLQHLDWSHNELSGGLPAELRSLFEFNLMYLDLSYNQLTGTIPSYFDGAPLTHADLSHNLLVSQVSVTAIENRCVFTGGKYAVLGNNFASQSGIDCVFVNRTSGAEASRRSAIIVSDTELLCESQYLKGCSVQSGERLLEYYKLNLAIDGSSVLSSPPEVGVVNSQCYLRSPGFALPLEIAALRLCEVVNSSTPWTMPTNFTVSSREYYPVSRLSPTCTSDECSPFPLSTTSSVYLQGTTSSPANVTAWGQASYPFFQYWSCTDPSTHSCSQVQWFCTGSTPIISPTSGESYSYYFFPDEQHCTSPQTFFRSESDCKISC